MKIIKKSKKLTEDQKSTEATSALQNADDLSKSEIADNVKDAVSDVSAETKEISNADANKIAKVADDGEFASVAIDPEINEDEPDLNSTDNILGDNVLTRTLDAAWAGSKKYAQPENVLIVGLPGSGKTSIVEAWARKRGIELFPMSADNRDVIQALSGIPLRDTEHPDKIKIMQLEFFDELDDPNHPKVVFLDEYNRAPEDCTAKILTFLNQRSLIDPNTGKKRRLRGLVFTVAAMNPYLREDKGAHQLNAASKSRFPGGTINWDSQNEVTKNFFEDYFDEKLETVAKKHEKIADAESWYRELYRKKDIGIFIVDQPTHRYDGVADIDEYGRLVKFDKKLGKMVVSREARDMNKIQTNFREQYNEWNHRMLVNTIMFSNGTKEDVLRRIRMADLNPDTLQMLEDILDKYIDLDDSDIEIPWTTPAKDSTETENAPAEEAPSEDDGMVDETDVEAAKAASELLGGDIDLEEVSDDTLKDLFD